MELTINERAIIIGLITREVHQLEVDLATYGDLGLSENFVKNQMERIKELDTIKYKLTNGK